MDLNLILKGQTLEKAKDFPKVVEKSKDYLRIVVEGIPDGFVATAYFRPSWENGKVYNLSMDRNSVIIDEYLTTLPQNTSEYVDYILGVSVVGVNANGARFTTNIVDIILDKTAYSAETENTPEIPQSQYEEVLLQIPSAVENALEVAKESGDFKGEPGEKGDKGEKGEVTLEYANNNFSNALKSQLTSLDIVRIDDVSPLEHEISVVLDVGGATVAKYGKNLAPSTFNFSNVPGLSITDNGDGSISIKGAVAQNSFSPLITNFVLPRGTYCVSGIFPSDWELVHGYAIIDGNQIHASTKVITLSERKMVSLSVVFIAGVQYDLVIRPQIEVGTTSTEWEKYKEPIIYTADKSGNVSGIVGNGNDITLTTNDEVKISVKYNKDINKMFTKLTQAIISLGGNV